MPLNPDWLLASLVYAMNGSLSQIRHREIMVKHHRACLRLSLHESRMKCAIVVATVIAAAGCAPKNDAAVINSSSQPGVRGAAIDSATKRDMAGKPDTTLNSIVPSGSSESPPPRLEIYYDKPIDSKYALVLTRVRDSLLHVVGLRVQMVDTAARERTWDVATLPASDFGLRVVRADTTSIAFARYGDYGQEMSVKLFLDPSSKKVIKRVDFSPWAGIDSISDHDVAIALSVPEAVIGGMKERDSRPAPGEPWDKYLPQVLKDHPMPASSYADFALARPERVKDGYGPGSEIGETPGPLQIDGIRIWFGKTFYDGEGSSGVGGAGYFDTVTAKYTFLKISELARWSVSSLLLDDHTLWIGMVGHPEGADYSGGLLRHDLVTGNTRKYAIDDVVLRIKRWSGRIYLTTGGGAAVIEGDRLIARYLSEPDANGEFVLLRVNP